MATKMFLRTVAHNELLKVLNILTQPAFLPRLCPRCFSGSCHCFQYTVFKRHDDNFSEGSRERNFPLGGRMTLNERVTSLRLRWGPSTGQLEKRGFSDSKIEELNEDVCSPTGEAENLNTESKSSKAPDGLSILEKCGSTLSDFSQTEGNETALQDEKRVENFIQEVDDQRVERFEGSENGNALARTEPDENEMGLQEAQVKNDILAEQESPTVLEEFIQPLLPTESLSLAAYADHSPTLQKLVELGVDLSKVEKKARIGNALIKMDFDRHIKDKIVFLHRAGVKSGDELGRLLTINPFVLTEDLENLETRLQYLRSKRFSDDAITQVLTRAPYFISFSVERVDSKLGFYQKALSLTGNDIRHIITKTPKLVTFKIQRVKENIFVLRRQLGFTASELKKLVLGEPKLLLRGKDKLIGIFDYVHNHMGISHKQLLKNPQVFNGRVFRMQERHQFLKHLGRAQYDPTQPGYVALERLTKLPDHIFCQDIAKSSIEEYNDFLKTL